MSKAEVDIIGGLMDWLGVQDQSLRTIRGDSWNGYDCLWFDLTSAPEEAAKKGTYLGVVTLIWPGNIPPGLQYDYSTRDEHGLLYCRKEWDKLLDPTIFDEVLTTAQTIRAKRPVKWHKFFRLKPDDPTIHRVVDPSWPPKFM